MKQVFFGRFTMHYLIANQWLINEELMANEAS